MWGGSVAEWLACWTQAQKTRVQIAVATLSGNSLRQTARAHCASVHQAAVLVAALLRVAGVTAGLAESNGSLPRVYDSRHLQANCQNRGQLRNPTLGNRVWATFTFFTLGVVPWANVSHAPDYSSIGSAFLAQQIVVTNRRTYTPRYICSNRPHSSTALGSIFAQPACDAT